MSTLPPRRTMPDDVRERLRTRVLGDRPGRPRSRGLLAAAAAVVLVAGGLVLSTSFDRETPPDTGHGTTTSPPSVSRLPLTPPPWEADLDRCWAALVDAGKTDGYPDRSEWRGAISSGGGGGRVSAAWAGETPIICETTPSQVSVSRPMSTPDYAADSRTGVLLRSENGAVAGVVDPSWAGVEVEYQYPDGASNGGDAEQAGGLFVFSSLENLRDPRLDLRLRPLEGAQMPPNSPFGGLEVGHGPEPITVIDRPGQPDEYAQGSLTQCLQAAGVPDAASWEVGTTWLSRAGGRIFGLGGTFGRQGDRVGLCNGDVSPPGPESFIDLGPIPVPAADDPPIRLRADLEYPAIMGLVSPDAAYVMVTFTHFTLRSTVVNSTFAVEDAAADPYLRVFDRNHVQLYEGPFAEGG